VATFDSIARSRLALADELDRLAPEDWHHPSLCAGWTIHMAAAHLNMPWSVSTPALMTAVLRSGGLDRGMHRLSCTLAERLDPGQCVAGLRDHASNRFTTPGLGPEAPLSDVVVHGNDMLYPLGRMVAPDHETLATALGWLSTGRARGFVPRGRVAGLTLRATDLDRTFGSGDRVISGTALALCSVLTGRTSMIEELSGPGIDLLASRIGRH
jgi:uncharacterized protein (TIGR03083 family)